MKSCKDLGRICLETRVPPNDADTFRYRASQARRQGPYQNLKSVGIVSGIPSLGRWHTNLSGGYASETAGDHKTRQAVSLVLPT